MHKNLESMKRGRDSEKRSKKEGRAAVMSAFSCSHSGLMMKGVGRDSEGGCTGVSWLLGLARACRKPNNKVCLRKSAALSGVFFMTVENLSSVLCVYTLELTPMSSS